MNKYQRLVLTAALINLLLIFLLPPFADQPLRRGALPSFEGFYPLLGNLGKKPIHTELLTLEVILIIINSLAAWLCLKTNRQENFQNHNYGRGITLFAMANLAIILAFPPFEPYSSFLRQPTSGFDSFYFVFGNHSARPIFTPLLYLECMLILVNALALYLLFSAIQRSETELAQLDSRRHNFPIEHNIKDSLASFGREKERRIGNDCDYRGPERRKTERRQG